MPKLISLTTALLCAGLLPLTGAYAQAMNKADFNMTEMARVSDLPREALYKTLSPTLHPRFDTIARVCTALGVKLVAQPVKA